MDKATHQLYIICNCSTRTRTVPKRCPWWQRTCSVNLTTNIPSNWQDHLQCPQCKHSIVEAIGLSLLQKGRYLLKDYQQLIIAGCFTGLSENDAWLLHPGEISAERPVKYRTNAIEADSRIW